MKLTCNLLAGAILAGSLALPSGAQPMSDTPTTGLGAEKKLINMSSLEVRNYQDETLGKVTDMGIDLVNGRIVEVLVVSGSFLGMGGKVVAVPPQALIPDTATGVYRLNVSAEKFKSAPEINLSKWNDAGRGERVAAAYHFFGQEPYFVEERAAPSSTPDGHPKVALGYVELSSKMIDLPVGNLQSQTLGKVWGLSSDIPSGRIYNVIVVSPNVAKTKSIVPAMALSFNAGRDGLLLDDSKAEFNDEPRLVYTAAANGNPAYSHEETYKGPHTSVALEQGSGNRDVDRTGSINRDIHNMGINARNVQVGTINGRVTLRGTVRTEDDRRRIGEIAIADSRLELVDNQITVGTPVVAVLE